MSYDEQLRRRYERAHMWWYQIILNMWRVGDEPERLEMRKARRSRVRTPMFGLREV